MAKVLIVDDEKGMRETLERILLQDNHQVETAGDAAEATQKLHARPYDILISDVMMPEINGIDLLKTIHHDFPEVKVLMITGQPTVETVSEAVRYNAFDFLTKPVLKNRLCDAVNSAAHQKWQEDQARQIDSIHEHTFIEQKRQIGYFSQRLKQISLGMRKFSFCRNLDQLATEILTVMAKNMGADGGSLFIRKERNLHLICSLDPGHQVDAIPLPPPPETVLGTLFRKKQAFYVNDITRDRNYQSSGWSGYKNGTLLALPFQDDSGEIQCVVTLHNKQRPPFTILDLELGMIIAAHSMEILKAHELNESLRNSEEKYRILAENSHTGIFIHQDNRLVYANSRMAELLKIPNEELTSHFGSPILDYVHPEDKERVARNIDRRIEDKSPEEVHSIQVLDKEGGSLLIDLSTTVITHKSRPAIMGEIVDVSRHIK